VTVWCLGLGLATVRAEVWGRRTTPAPAGGGWTGREGWGQGRGGEYNPGTADFPVLGGGGGSGGGLTRPGHTVSQSGSAHNTSVWRPWEGQGGGVRTSQTGGRQCQLLTDRLQQLEREMVDIQRRLATDCGSQSSSSSSSSPSSSSSSSLSCSGKCGARFNRTLPCQCNTGCGRYSNCCQDYNTVCLPSSSSSSSSSSPSHPQITWSSGRTTDTDLARLSEELLNLDRDGVQVRLNLGCTTRVGNPRDCSTAPLIQRLDPAILRKDIYRKLIALYENYNAEVTLAESVTRQERQEEEAFLREVVRSPVMQEALRFLAAKRLFNGPESEFIQLLKTLWFEVYSRGGRILGSSGFEHVFLGEQKLGKVQGFHNWFYFYYLENKGQVNYLGHWQAVPLGERTGLSFTFKWGPMQKAFASMMIGTSPSLEMALYTVCILARENQPCHLKLGTQAVTVTNHLFTRPRGIKYVASSFMDWE